MITKHAIQISPYQKGDTLPKRGQAVDSSLSPFFKNDIASQPNFWLDDAKDIVYCESGREAIYLCLKHLKLKRNDEVYIETTTGGKYISGCVTKTIEKVCRWSQNLSSKTKLILVIHEFGFPFNKKRLLKLEKFGLPILEDCAYGFGTRLAGGEVGKIGDFAIYSLTKYFPSSFGGILVSRKKINPKLKLSSAKIKLLKQTINLSQNSFKQWNQTRLNNWRFFQKKLGKKFPAYFPSNKFHIPGAFVFRIPSSFPGEKVKKQLNDSGVESTQYYHMGGFYFPVHQFLSDGDKKHILQNFNSGTRTN